MRDAEVNKNFSASRSAGVDVCWRDACVGGALRREFGVATVYSRPTTEWRFCSVEVEAAPTGEAGATAAPGF